MLFEPCAASVIVTKCEGSVTNHDAWEGTVSEEQASCEVGTNLGETDYKRRLAYKCLGIRPQDVAPAPFFAINLKRIARCINRGARKDDPVSSRMHPLDYLGFSEDPEARKVFDAYRSVPASYRRLLPPEAFCHAAGIAPSHILEVVTIVAIRLGAIASSILAASMSPSVVGKTIAQALQPDGYKERLLLCKASGFVPTWGWKGYGF